MVVYSLVSGRKCDVGVIAKEEDASKGDILWQEVTQPRLLAYKRSPGIFAMIKVVERVQTMYSYKT